MSDSLDMLLKRLRDGHGSAEDLARARAAVRADDRLPEDLRAEVFTDPADTEADAAGVLAVLGLDHFWLPGSQPGEVGATIADAVLAEAFGSLRPRSSPSEPDFSLSGVASATLELPELDGPDEAWEAIARTLREGLEAEARGFEVAEAVLRRLPAAGFAHAALVSSAVTAEAGPVDLSAAVLAGLGEGGIPVAEAVQDEAGQVDVVEGVLGDLGLARLPVREAIRAEAGRVDVVGGVMATIGVWRVDVVRERPAVARPVNRWGVAGFAVAAMALLSVVVGRLATPLEEGPRLVFASASEVQIEDLDVAADVQVAQLEGDGGAVILWLDEEA